MAGIKNIYRSPDAFRLPTYDEVISYSVNSIVAYFDSDTSQWDYYISKTQTTAGSLDSDIALNEWTRFSFDSDTLAQYAQKALENNFNSLTAALDSDFASTLAQLDSDNDSDFRVLYAKVDSDVQALKHYVDSEINLLDFNLNKDWDSDIAAMTSIVNNYINEVKYGRVYDSEAILIESVSSRLVNQTIDAADARYIIADFLDQVQEQTSVVFRGYTSSVANFAGALYQNVNGAHKIAPLLDSETIFGYFTPHAYVGSFSFRGVESGLGGGYFTSAKITWTYTDNTTHTEVQELVALDNTTRITFYNPNIEKTVFTISVTAWNRSNDAPGMNYIQISSGYAAEVLYAERTNILHFQSTAEMVRYSPHPDTIAMVHSTKAMFSWSVDSEWVAVDPRYRYVDTTISNLNYNFPPLALEDNVRALTTSNGYEYIVRSGVWTLDTNSVDGYDSDLVHNLDSDFAVLTQRYDTFYTNFWQNIEAFDDRLEQNDSEIVTLQRAMMSFYKDYVALKQEHLIHTRDTDSDLVLWQQKFDRFVTNTTNTLNLYLSNISDADSDQLIAINNTVNNNYTATAAVVQALKEDHDSDTEVLQNFILANAVDISLLRNGPVADNDSDIRVLEYRVSNHDSELAYIRKEAMKYRGILSVNDSDDYPKMVEFGDVYINDTASTAVSLYGALADETVPYGALIMYTSEFGWTVINAGSSSANFTKDNIGVPAGTILTFPTHQAIPAGFHICDGSVYDPGLYSELYSVLLTNTLPDFRGYFLRGWSVDNTVDPDGPRAPGTIQNDQNKGHNHGGGAHTHTYLDTQRSGNATVSGGAFGEEVADDGTDFNYRTTSTASNFLDSDGGKEARPKNVAVVYAIAMYSGAGSSYGYDSDVRAKVAEHDSDIRVQRIDHDNLDSNFKAHLVAYAMRDSDISDRISENDSEILVIQNTLATLVGQFNLVQFSQEFDILTEGVVNAGTEYDITPQVVNTATPELFCYPDIQFFFETRGANASPTAPGRRLDGTNGTPRVSYRVIHDGAGNMSIAMSSDTTITHNIRIVSTFRTR